MLRHRCGKRKGTIAPLLALSMVGLLGMVALAVDLGLVAIARNQCQNAADISALAGVRSLTGITAGSADNNYSGAQAMALTAAEANQVLTQPIQSSQVTITIGKWYFDTTANSFLAYPLDSGSVNNSSDNWTLVNSNVTFTSHTAFAGVFGINVFSAQASAAAIHRPIDLAILMDFSGSMRFSSLLGLSTTNSGFYGQLNMCNNPDPNPPTFGQYSASTCPSLTQTSSPTYVDPYYFDACNNTASSSLNYNRSPIVGDFYASLGSSPVAAFSPAATSYATTPGGDVPLKINANTGGTYAVSVYDLLNPNSNSYNSTFETGGGYTSTAASNPALTKFNGYTAGPNYWGKAFFIWPPNPGSTTVTTATPSGTWDWRRNFFVNGSQASFTTTDTTNAINNALWNSSGVWNSPGSSTYYPNYQAILSWIQNTGPNPFPSSLIAGYIQYYTAMPSTTDSTLNSRWWSSNGSNLSNPNEQFWKDYIDWVLGNYQTGSNSWYSSFTQWTGYGPDFKWTSSTVSSTAINSSKTSTQYMNYKDNPQRPQLHFWFGPMTMIDFLDSYNGFSLSSYQKYVWWPGTCHEAPCYTCKIGMNAALQSIQANHPNHWVSLMYYSEPNDSATDTSYGGRFNAVRAPLGQNYTRMMNALWFPPYTLNNPGGTINPYDYSNNIEVPRAMGGTCYSYPLMLAYNQFSSNTSLQTFDPSPAPSGNAGGLGRIGAQKVVILETDGLPNSTASANLVNNGANQSYYEIRYNSTTPSSSDFPTSVADVGNNASSVTSQIYTIVQQLAAQTTASPPGYSTPTKPVLVHTIAFGPVFTPGTTLASSALATLQQIQTYGNTQSSASTPLPSYKIINGTDATVASDMQTAITNILSAGVVPVSLLR